jgi:hypothetical protein
MSHMTSRRGLILALALALAAVAPRATADPTREDRAAATALFDEGRKLAADKKYAEACPKFEAAMRLDPGMGTLFNLSDCYEHIGRTASAWSGFRDVASQAKAANQPDREKAARDRAAALEPKLARVRLVVPADLAGTTLTITRDGSPLPSALAGTPIPFDPGTHTLRVEAEGRSAWETKVTLSPNGGTIDVNVPSLAPAPAGSTAPPARSAPTGTTAPPDTASAPPPTTAGPSGAQETASPRPWQKPLGITAAVAGVAALGAGIAVGFVAKGTFDESNKTHCDAKTNGCDAEGNKMRLAAVEQGNIGTVLGIAGGVVAAAGVVLWLTAPSAKQAPAKGAALPSVQVGAGAGSLVIRGRF